MLFKGPFQPIIRRLEPCDPAPERVLVNYTLHDVTTRETYKRGPTYNIDGWSGRTLDKSLAVSFTNEQFPF